MAKENKCHSVFNDWNNTSVWEVNPVQYDDIVDDSDFKPTAERIRDGNFSSNGSSYDWEKLPYDYAANQPITEKVDDVSLALRNGKLDKADVQKLNELVSDKLSKDSHDKKVSNELAQAEKATKNREKALDNLLNVNIEDN